MSLYFGTESSRVGLVSFKRVQGASRVESSLKIRIVAQCLGKDISQLFFSRLFIATGTEERFNFSVGFNADLACSS
jgi:hypothetical protein